MHLTSPFISWTLRMDSIKGQSLETFFWTTDISVPIDAAIEFEVDLNQKWRRIFNEVFKSVYIKLIVKLPPKPYWCGYLKHIYPFKYQNLKQDFLSKFWWILSYSRAKSLSHPFFFSSLHQAKWLAQNGAPFLFV